MLSLVLPLAPPAQAGECDADEAAWAAGGVAVAVAAGGSCPEEGTRGRSIDVLVSGAGQRVEVQWAHYETPYGNESSISASAPPRFVVWHDDVYGCTMAVNVAGTLATGCPAGAPPPPP